MHYQKIEAEKTLKVLAQAKAREMWAAFDANQKHGVRFGLFPAGPMKAATDLGHDSRMLAVALMDEATRDGGMRA